MFEYSSLVGTIVMIIGIEGEERRGEGKEGGGFGRHHCSCT